LRFFPLVWSGLARNPVRSILTFCSIILAFMLFGVVQGTSAALERIVDRSGGTRLRVTSRIDLGTGLPLAYRNRIGGLGGVDIVSGFTWFPSYFQDSKMSVTANSVDPVTFFAMFPEWELSPGAYDAMLRARTGAIIGAGLVQKYGWRVGERIPLISTLWKQKDGSNVWNFNVVGVYHSKLPGVPSNQFFIRYDYLDEARSEGTGTVMQFAVKIHDPLQGSAIAQHIDELFTNSSDATFTQDESDWLRSNVSNIDNISVGVRVVVSAVLFTLLIVIGITMLQSIRERIPELGVLKAQGFGNRLLTTIVLLESLMLAVPAAALGLLLAALAFPHVFSAVLERTVPLPESVFAIGLALSCALALAGSVLPAYRMQRLKVIEALAYAGGRL
jgi:putative ABC transport system permease protein